MCQGDRVPSLSLLPRRRHSFTVLPCKYWPLPPSRCGVLGGRGGVAGWGGGAQGAGRVRGGASVFPRQDLTWCRRQRWGAGWGAPTWHTLTPSAPLTPPPFSAPQLREAAVLRRGPVPDPPARTPPALPWPPTIAAASAAPGLDPRPAPSTPHPTPAPYSHGAEGTHPPPPVPHPPGVVVGAPECCRGVGHSTHYPHPQQQKHPLHFGGTQRDPPALWAPPSRLSAGGGQWGWHQGSIK